MPSDHPPVRFLLDEHYPGWLADALAEDGIDTVALIAHRPELRGADDRAVLQAAIKEGRIVVTEDVTTFAAAVALVPDHIGVVYCHHARYPRTRSGLHRLQRALAALSATPPAGLGEHPVEWWLPDQERSGRGGPYTRAVSLGRPRLPDVDDVSEALAVAEGEDHR